MHCYVSQGVLNNENNEIISFCRRKVVFTIAKFRQSW